jgi:hypothetical protein
MEKTAHFERMQNGTRVPVRLGPAGSVFVVFKKSADAIPNPVVEVTGPQPLPVLAGKEGVYAYAKEAGTYELKRADKSITKLAVAPLPEAISLDQHSWTLEFMPGRDMPGSIPLDALTFWTDLENKSIMYYSGTASYGTTFDIPKTLLDQNDLRLELDLGIVDPMARVRMNGQDLGLLWKPPFVVDVTDHLRAGKNELKVDVTNLWSNRLVGELNYPDGFPGAKKQTFKPEWLSKGRVTAERDIQPSGLAGPVKIISIRQVLLEP